MLAKKKMKNVCSFPIFVVKRNKTFTIINEQQQVVFFEGVLSNDGRPYAMRLECPKMSSTRK